MSGRVPFPDTTTFARQLRRTRLGTIFLSVALVIAGTVALAAVPRLRSGGPEPQPPPPRAAASDVIVLDVSASVRPERFRQIEQALREAERSRRPAGLVLFSDTAYEALPPGTPASQLRAFRRLFAPRAGRRGFPVASTVYVEGSWFAVNPWMNSFSGGTNASSGLRLAAALRDRDGVRTGRVVLVSDLLLPPGDLGELEEVVAAYVRNQIPLRVVALGPMPPEVGYLRPFVGGTRDPGPPPATPPELPRVLDTASGGSFPGAFVAGALALLALLAVNELWCARLAWRAAEARPE